MWTYARAFWVLVHPLQSDFQIEKSSSAPQMNRGRRAGEARSTERPLSGLEAGACDGLESHSRPALPIHLAQTCH